MRINTYTRVQGSCFSGNVATARTGGYPVGSDVHVYIDKNPVVEAIGNWWADVHVQPMLGEQPAFCR